jgi:glucose/arabinose dehydrogenase
VRVIRLGANGRPAKETRIAIDERVRDVRVGPDGFIYVLTDEPEGRILRIRPTS